MQIYEKRGRYKGMIVEQYSPGIHMEFVFHIKFVPLSLNLIYYYLSYDFKKIIPYLFLLCGHFLCRITTSRQYITQWN